MDTSPALHWHSCSQTDRGMAASVNEDACLELPQEGLWIVADGMGGYLSGEFASHAVIDSLRTIKAGGSLGQYAENVARRLQEVNRNLRAEAARRDALTIGSTVVALLLSGKQFRCLWAGDSRLYLYRDDELVQLTHDHSLVEELIQKGVIPAGTTSHPAQNIITRSVGGEDELQLESVSGDLRAGDIFLLCSDGLYKELTDREIAAILRQGDLAYRCRRLIEHALACGAHDNVTAMLVQVEGGGKS